MSKEDYHEDNSNVGYNGTYSRKTTENQNSCLKFYSFLDDGSERIKLLLDHDTSTAEDNLLARLKLDTDEWNGTLTPISYSYNRYDRSYTIDYTGYKARIISAQEIAQIIGALQWDETSASDSIFFENALQDYETGNGRVCAKKGCKYAWLYDRIGIDCKKDGCLNNSNTETGGYWTASAHGYYDYHVWYVMSNGSIGYNPVDNDWAVRPVTEVYRSSLR